MGSVTAPSTVLAYLGYHAINTAFCVYTDARPHSKDDRELAN